MKKSPLALVLTISLAMGLGLWSLNPRAQSSSVKTNTSSHNAIAEQSRQMGMVVIDKQVSFYMCADFKEKRAFNDMNVTARYAILDEAGAKLARHYDYFHLSNDETIQVLYGKTTLKDGTVIKLDPKKDVHSLDIVRPDGTKVTVQKTAFFPRVEPGATLELQWDQNRAEGGFGILNLMEKVPIQHLKVQSSGLIWRDLFCVPFWLTAIPPKTKGKLDENFNLNLEVWDLPAETDLPDAPVPFSTDYALAWSMRRVKKGKSRKKVMEHKLQSSFFGSSRSTVNTKEDHPTADQGRNFLVSYDALGLQHIPAWWQDPVMVAEWSEALKVTRKKWQAFLSGGRRVESTEEINQIAPRDLPWLERAKKIYEHVRKRVRPVTDHKPPRSMNAMLRHGLGTESRISLYYAYLLNEAGIENHILLARPRLALPIIPTFAAFNGEQIVLEVGPPGKDAHYFFPGDPFGDFDTFSSSYLGGLAWELGKSKGQEWTMTKLPKSLPLPASTTVNYHAPLPVVEEYVPLEVDLRLEGSPAWRLRWKWHYTGKLEDAQDKKDGRKKKMEDILYSWAHIEMNGDPPALKNYAKPSTGPLAFTMKGKWNPETQWLGSTLMVPAMPNANLLHSRYSAEKRKWAMWLPGGDYLLRMHWKIPKGFSPGPLPPTKTLTGAQGAKAEFSVQSGKGSDSAEVITQIRLHLPYILPSTDYPVMRAFFEDLEKLAVSKITFESKEDTP